VLLIGFVKAMPAINKTTEVQKYNIILAECYTGNI
jgi:hypothetical protein